MGKHLRKLCERVSKGLERCVRRFCPHFHRLFYTGSQEHRVLKGVVGFFYGLALGIVFYYMILIDLEFPPLQCVALGFIICLMLAIGNAVSVQIRCISLLTIPSFCGRAGRGVLKAVILAYVIAGPVHNLASNCREVVRVFTCSATLSFNMSLTRFELMVRPFYDAILQMKADMGHVKRTFRTVQEMAAPVVGEIEGDEEMFRIKEDNDYLDELHGDSSRSKEIIEKYKAKLKDTEGTRYEKGYKMKLEMRCQDMLNKGASRCESFFESAYDRCYKKVSWFAAWLLCWPMKLTFVCNIMQAIGGGKTCDAASGMEPGFGEGYAYLKRARGSMSEEFRHARLQYEVKPLPPQLDVRQASDTAEAIIHDFNTRKAIVDSLLTVIKRALAFIFIKIILRAQEYHDKFIMDIEFDNNYVTPYFRKIDARRRTREEMTILPLKKVELAEMVDPYALAPSKSERSNLVSQTVKLLLEMLTAVAFLLLDMLLFETLDLVRKHAHIEYTQTGAHDLVLEVKGTGMISSLVRSILRGFNVKKRINLKRTNDECLPRPHAIPKYYYYKIFGSYLGVWLLILTNCYTQRLRRVICAYYYPKREKRRVLHLYNESLKRRIGSARFQKARVRRKAREQRLELETTVAMVMRVRFPRCCGWLSVFPSARRRCLICDEPEPRRQEQQRRYFHECETPSCHFVYCNVCWWEVDEICYACSVDELESDTEEEYEDRNVL